MSQQTRQDQVPQDRFRESQVPEGQVRTAHAREVRPGDEHPGDAPLRDDQLRDDVDVNVAGTAAPTPRDPEDITTRWRDIQATFVDDPRAAVRHADALVAEAMDRVARTMSDRRGTLGHSWSEESTSTEDLRTCLQGYRALLERVSAIHV